MSELTATVDKGSGLSSLCPSSIVACDPRGFFSSDLSVFLLLFFSSFFVVFVTATGISLCVVWFRERSTRSALKAVRKASSAREGDPLRNSLRNPGHPFPNNQRFIDDCEHGNRVNNLDGKSLNQVSHREFIDASDDEESHGVRVRSKGSGHRLASQEKALSLTTFSVTKSNSLRDVNRRNSIVSDKTLFTNSSNESPPLISRTYRVHHVLREVLMIERTFCKELDLICSWVRDFFESEFHSSIQSEAFMTYLSLLEPLADVHTGYLHDLESELASLSSQDGDERSLSFDVLRLQSLVEPIVSCLEVTSRQSLDLNLAANASCASLLVAVLSRTDRDAAWRHGQPEPVLQESERL